jgi:mRNA interferase MazF
MKNYNAWNKVKQETDKLENTVKLREGEIRWCRFGINIGNEIIGKGDNFKRPVLILKKYSGQIFLGLPVTSTIRDGDWYFKINHNDIDRCIILNQGRSLDSKRLEEKIFEISEKELEKVRERYCKLILE